eukprot:NODE_324_length_9702_cov_1.027491.p8 type:complete len:148 gc:universal NODE_324_length_9702_cov_1.027491:8590-8147(-)
MKILVTVGTTNFDELIDSILISKSLFDNHSVVMQIGSYKKKIEPLSNFKMFDYCDNMNKYYDESDYIISHGGTGTILNGLRRKKLMLVVPNSKLLGNHQVEIIEKLQSLNLIHTCKVDEICLNFKTISSRPQKSSEFTVFIEKLLKK